MATGIFTCYTHIYMKVLNCGYIYRVAMDTELYLSGDVYTESILVYCFHCVLIYLLWGWAIMNLPTGTLTAQRVARLDAYIERTYVCHRVCR